MCVSECAGLETFSLVFSLAPRLLCELCAKAGASLRALCVLCVTLAADSAVVSQWSGG